MTDSRYILASRLARFFRKNGDKIINGSCKLSLTTSALCLLNSLFRDVLQQDIRVDHGDSSLVEIQEDVRYLFDFMKKTTSLKLFHGMQTLRGGVDFSQFSNLTVLELRKIPAHLIIGLNSLSGQLKALICSRSIYLLKELFGTSFDEHNNVDIWIELKELNLSYNYLESLDNSIKCIPHVEILDLSHNNIKNVDEIQVLKRLNCVNISYNQLESLPVFSSLSCRFISKLYVRNNNLENLDGLECLFNLEEFDVGYNLLSVYSVLIPLDKLKSLKLLNLEGNPLFFHKQHFRLVCTFLHPFALNRGLHLNGKFIAIPQNMIIFNREDEMNSGRHQTSINTVVGDMQSAVHPLDIKHELLKAETSSISVTSNKSSLDENAASSYTSRNSIEKPLATGTRPKKKKVKSKDKKERIAVINDPEEEVAEIEAVILKPKNNEMQRHLLVKEKYETRREERGKSWLIPDNPFKTLENELKVPENTPVCKAETASALGGTPGEKNVDNEMLTVVQRLEGISSTPVNSELQEILDIQSGPASDTDSDRKRHISKESDDIEVLASNLQSSSADALMKVLSAEDLSDCEFYRTTSDPPAGMNDEGFSDSEDETEDSIFLAERLDNKNERGGKMVSIQIGAKYAKEKDVITGKLLHTLDLSTLLSVRQVTQPASEDDEKSCEVHLEFDTVKTSRQQRLYHFQDLVSANAMCNILQPFADASALKEATIGALECMNCKSIFSKQVAHRKVLKTKKPLNNKDGLSSSFDASKGYLYEADACPNCGNHIVVELDSMPLPSVAAPPAPTPLAAAISPSGSTGSASSGYMFSNLLNSFKISPAPKRKSVAGSTNDSQGEMASKTSETIGINYQNEKDYSKQISSDSAQMSRNSSDVTIISNPSQSSIAVIPDPGVESDLNTIVERDSQASLSPPASQSSTIHNIEKGHRSEGKNADNYGVSSKEDPDFYSITESFTEDEEKPFKFTDVLSSGSDAYHSPTRSAGSSNLQNSVEASESDMMMLILSEKKNVTHDSFMHLDHRLKLHIEINIFDKDEYVNSCLETSIVPLSTGEEFTGVFLLSTKKLYVIKFLPQYSAALEENKPLAKCIQALYSGPLSQMKQIKVLLGNQGISIGCGPPTHVYTLVIRDVDVCNSFCSLISEKILEKNPFFQCITSAEEMLSILYESVIISDSEEKQEILLHQFAFKKDKDLDLPICITLTKEDIFLSKVLYKKQQSCSDLTKMEPYFCASSDCQKVSDVVSLKLGQHFTVVEVCFLIESAETESTLWIIEMPTKSAMFSFITALKNPWEEIFGVPLPLTKIESSS